MLQSTAKEDSSGAAARVLVVDDDPEVRGALKKALRQSGFEVMEAENGLAGLLLATEQRPEIILLDLRMPQMDGHTVLRRLASAAPEAAVIVISSCDSREDIIDALRAGIVDFVPKPWSCVELSAALARASVRRSRDSSGSSLPMIPRIGVADLDVARVPRVPAALAPSDDGDLGQRSPPAVGALRPSMATSEPSLTERWHQLPERIRGGSVSLPRVPSVLNKIRGALSKSEPSIVELGSLIEREPSVGARVLRLANSGCLGRGQVNGIQAAVARLGTRQLKNLVESVFLAQSSRAPGPHGRRLQAAIWRFSVARAHAMRGLVAQMPGVRTVDPEAAYAAGLFADVGALFLVSSLQDADIEAAGADEIRSALSATHQQVGVEILKVWGLTALDAAVCAAHHAQGSIDSAREPHENFLIVAGAIGAECVGGDPTETAPPSLELINHCGAELGLGTTEARAVKDAVSGSIAALEEWFPVDAAV